MGLFLLFPISTKADIKPPSVPTIQRPSITGPNIPGAKKKKDSKPTVKAPQGPINYKTLPNSVYGDVLDAETYAVCRQNGTEPESSGKFVKFNEKGVYYCACCGGDYPVFDSDDKYNANVGWATFKQPIDSQHISLNMDVTREEKEAGIQANVRCARCLSHLGYMSGDGPKPSGKRYTINSVALAFSPENDPPERTFTVPSR